MNRSTYDQLVSNIDTLRAEFRDPENVDEGAVRALTARIFRLAHGYEARELVTVCEWIAKYPVLSPTPPLVVLDQMRDAARSAISGVRGEENDNG